METDDVTNSLLKTDDVTGGANYVFIELEYISQNFISYLLYVTKMKRDRLFPASYWCRCCFVTFMCLPGGI